MIMIAKRAGLMRAICILAVVAGLTSEAFAQAELTFGTPTILATGDVTTGLGMTALYSNVGTQDATGIDVLATIVESNAGESPEFSETGGDLKFLLKSSSSGNWRVTVLYEFFETGTSIRLPIQQMVWSIDDIDRTSSRQEEVTVSGASAFTLNDPTNIDVTDTGTTLTFLGTANQNGGEPDGACAFLFMDEVSVVINYTNATTSSSGSDAGFEHDGNGNFGFPAPEPKWIAPFLYYTFRLLNEEDVEVDMDFTDMLPADLKWDTSFTPVTSEGLVVEPGDITYADTDRTINITSFAVPPGESTLQLRTIPVEIGGTFANEATLSVADESDFPPLELTSNSSIELPSPPPDYGIYNIQSPPPPPPPASDDDDEYRHQWYSDDDD